MVVVDDYIVIICVTVCILNFIKTFLYPTLFGWTCNLNIQLQGCLRATEIDGNLNKVLAHGDVNKFEMICDCQSFGFPLPAFIIVVPDLLCPLFHFKRIGDSAICNLI